MKDKFKVLKYIESTRARFRNEKEMCAKLSRIFKIEYSYAWQIWTNIKNRYPELKRKCSKTKKQIGHRQKRDRFGFRRPSYKDKNLIVFEPKVHITNVPKFSKTKRAPKKETINLKDVKPTSGFETVWKQGKLKPAVQKNYRGSFQDKD
jgi:hypothetical protein